MRPEFVKTNPLHGRTMNRKLCGYIFNFQAFFLKLTDFINLAFRQFRQNTSFSFRRSSFLNTIANIIKCSSNEQVVRITARRIVARMQNKLAVGNWTSKQLPSVSVCPIVETFTTKLPVSVFVKPKLPLPAPVVHFAEFLYEAFTSTQAALVRYTTRIPVTCSAQISTKYFRLVADRTHLAKRISSIHTSTIPQICNLSRIK